MLGYNYFRAKHYSAAAITLHFGWTQKPNWVMNNNFFEIGFIHTNVLNKNAQCLSLEPLFSLSSMLKQPQNASFLVSLIFNNLSF